MHVRWNRPCSNLTNTSRPSGALVLVQGDRPSGRTWGRMIKRALEDPPRRPPHLNPPLPTRSGASVESVRGPRQSPMRSSSGATRPQSAAQGGSLSVLPVELWGAMSPSPSGKSTPCSTFPCTATPFAPPSQAGSCRHPPWAPPGVRGAACEGQTHHCHTKCTPHPPPSRTLPA